MSDPKLHERLVTGIQTATQEVFSTMLGLEIRAGKAYVDQSAPRPAGGVVALIGLAGKWMGTGTVTCSAELACSISSHLLMSEYAGVDEEVLDAVAEVTNMIIGNVKTSVEEDLGALGLSIPTVIFGRNFTTLSIGANDWTVVPFECGAESMAVHMCLMPAKTELHVRPGFIAAHALGD